MPPAAFVNAFAGNPLDRASARRSDPDWISAEAASPDALALPFWNGAPLLEGGPGGGLRLAYVDGRLAGDLAGGMERLLFLGRWREASVFALDLEGGADPAEGPLQGLGRFQDLRRSAPNLAPGEAAIAATAKAVFEWRRRHRHCSVCGAVSDVAEGGWKRVCPACRAEHFPRTDPVVIMLPVQGDRCCLGRQASWPAGMWSALAGFVEPGESLEEACARELREEADLVAVGSRYHSSQPWPFPSSLMIGLIAEVAPGEGQADVAELEALRWFERDEARRLLEGAVPGAFAPPPLAIAHQLLRSWAYEAEGG